MNRSIRLILFVFVCAPFIYGFTYYKTSKNLPVKWFPRNIPVAYYLNQNGSDDISSFSLLESAVTSSFQTWENVDGTSIRFSYKGVTSALPETEKSSPKNVVGWIESNWVTQWENDKDAIGVTTVIYYDDTGEIVQADMQLNGEYFTWTLDPPSSCPPSSNLVDVRNIVTHEAGHFIGLDHSSDPEATMYYSSPPCETSKRDLALDDINGIRFLYPDGSNSPYITQIYPSSANNTLEDFKMKIYGGNFSSPVQVRLEGKETITSFESYLIKSDEIEAHFDLRGASPGVYSVVVICNYTSAPILTSLDGVFEIKEAEEGGGCGCDSGGDAFPLFFEMLLGIFFLKLLNHVSGKRKSMAREEWG